MKSIGSQSCVFCGGGKPTKIYVHAEGDMYNIECKECAAYLGSYIIADGDYAQPERRPRLPHNTEDIPERVDFAIWEVVFYENRMIERIHGKYVSGDRRLLPLIEFYSQKING